MLQAYLSHCALTRDKGVGILEQVLGLERLAEEYRSVAGEEIAQKTKISVLLRVTPQKLRQHVQLMMGGICEKLLSLERATSSWVHRVSTESLTLASVIKIEDKMMWRQWTVSPGEDSMFLRPEVSQRHGREAVESKPSEGRSR